MLAFAKTIKSNKENLTLDEEAGFFKKWGKNRSQKKSFNKLKKDVINLEEVTARSASKSKCSTSN